jgi:RHS repeat-associated protein
VASNGSSAIALGSNGTFTVAASGHFVLLFNDSQYADNSGSYTVCMTPMQTAPAGIRLLVPTNGQYFVSKQDIALAADAYTGTGTITKVLFFDGTTLVGQSTSAPYMFTWSGTNVSAGSHFLSASASNSVGNYFSSTVATVTVGSAMAVAITNPVNQTVFPQYSNISITATAAPPAGLTGVPITVQFYGNNILLGQATNAPYTITWTNVPYGEYALMAVASDSLGDTASSTPIALVVNSPPTVTLLSPASNVVMLAGIPLTLAAAASDIDGYVTNVSFFGNGTLLGSATNSPYTRNWTTPTNTSSVTICAVATDNHGALSTSACAVITISNLPPPLVSIQVPTNNATFHAPTNISITATASSPASVAIANVSFYVDSVFLSTDTSMPYTAVWSNATPGVHAFFASASDIAGGQATSAVAWVTVHQGNSVAITSPQTGQTNAAPAQITLTARVQGDMPVTSVTYYTNGTYLVGTTSASPYLLPVTNLPAGTYNFTAVATDANGYTAISQPVTNTVQRQPPAVAIISPHSNDLFAVGQPITIQANASDLDGVITNIQFLAGNVALGHVTNSPYTFAWTTGLPATSTNLFAVAWNDGGLSTTSVAIPINVQGCTGALVTNVTLGVSQVQGGNSLSGSVWLAASAVTGGEIVNLSSSGTNVIPSSYVYVPQGQTNVSFIVNTFLVSGTNTITIGAAYHSQTPKTVNVTVLGVGTNSIGAPSAVRPGFDANVVTPDFSGGPHGGGDGSTNTTTCTTPGDCTVGEDGAAGPINISFPIAFYCEPFTNLWINMNGLLTFGHPYYHYTPDVSIGTLSNTPIPAIAPFWADVDPRGSGSGTLKFGTNTVDGHLAIGATWDNVGYYTEFGNGCCLNPQGKLNRFQVVLIERSETGGGNFDIEFNYDQIHWETGNDSDGSSGLGGFSARFGFGNGQGIGFELPGSAVNGALLDTNSTGLIHGSYNSSVLGRYVFPVRCTSEGQLVVVRDDLSTNYPPLAIVAPAVSGQSSNSATFDVKAIDGTVIGAYLERAGALSQTGGAQYDLELGVASTSGVASSFGLLLPGFQNALSTTNYSIQWGLPAGFNADLQTQLGGKYFIELSNRVSGICGSVYTVTDTLIAGWPVQKNILTFASATQCVVPQGRCRSFILAGTEDPADTPVNGGWDITRFGQVVASSGNPNGWNVEPDYTPFNGYTITVPKSATVGGGYKARAISPGSIVGSATAFSVLLSNALPSAPVLLPLSLSTNVIQGSTVVAMTVAFDAPAPFGDAHVTLTTNGLAGSPIPQSVVIPAGQTALTTNIQVTGGTTGTLAIMAEYNGYREANVRVVTNACVTPGVPQNLSVTATNKAGAPGDFLAWNVVTNAESYNVSRGTNGTNFAVIFTGLTTTNFLDTDVIIGTTNYYYVTAVSGLCKTNSAPTSAFVVPNLSTEPAPSIIPFGGAFNGWVQVLVTNPVSGATIYYSTNGVPPNTGSPSFVTGGIITLTSNATVMAFSKSSSYSQQSVTESANFIIAQPTPITCGTQMAGSLSSTSNAYSIVQGEGFYGALYTFVGTAGTVITNTLSSTGFDSFLCLLDPSTNVIAADAGVLHGNTNSQVVTSIPSNGVYTIEVTSFDPLATGSFSLKLDCSTSPRMRVFTNACPIATNSVPLPNYSSIDFGSVTAGSSATVCLSITNSGYSTLHITGLQITQSVGNAFSASLSPYSTIATGAVTQLTITLSSTNVGLYSGYLIVTNDDPSVANGAPQNPFFVNLKGYVSFAGPPFVSIYFPTNGTVIPQTPVNLEIAAIAEGINGIKQVAFLTNGVAFQTVSSGFYDVIWTNVPSGTDTITAIATDNSISPLSSTSTVTITVGAGTLTLMPTNACAGLSNTTFTATATFSTVIGQPVTNSTITFNVTGVHPSVTNILTSSTGAVVFTYTGTNFGPDRIVATGTLNSQAIQSATIIKDWAMAIQCSNTISGTLTNTDGFLIGCGCASPEAYADFYSFTGSSGNVITVTMTSTNFSTYMFLMNTNCMQYGLTNTALNATDTLMQFTLPTNGTYLIEATSFDIFQTGPYTLNLACGTNSAPQIGVLVAGTNLVNGGTVNFGTTLVGTPVSMSLVITNKGNTTLIITNAELTSAYSLNTTPDVSVAAGASASFTLQFLAPSSGQFPGQLILGNTDPNRSTFILNLTAIANPTGSPPTVSLTAPSSGAQFSAPANVALTANAVAAAGASVSQLYFYATNSAGSLTGAQGIAGPNNTYSASWYQPTPGSYGLWAVAVDSSNRVATSSSVAVQVLPSTQTQPPVALPDVFTVNANSVNNLLNVLANDTDPDNNPLTIVSVSKPGIGTVTTINNGTALQYTPSPNTYGTDGFQYTINDGKGLTATASVNITIQGGPIPQFTITGPAPTNGTGSLNAGSTTNVTLMFTTPTQNIVKVEYYIGTDLIGTVSNAPFTSFNWYVRAAQCTCGLQAAAYDKFGQRGISQSVHYSITNNGASVVAQITSPAPGTQTPVVTAGILTVSGSVYQVQGAVTNAAQYDLQVKTLEGTVVTDTGWLPSAKITKAAITNLDLTTLQNDEYELDLLVQNSNATAIATNNFILASNLKIGQFSFSQQDLVIPVNGIPLQVTRTYSTLNPNAGDFGFSWTYAINDVNVTLHETRAAEDPFDDIGPGPGGTFSLRVGGSRDVTLTLPDGTRTTFYYYEQTCDCFSQGNYCICPHYAAGPGIHASLIPVDANGNYVGGYNAEDGTWNTQGDGTPIQNFDFPGFILTTQDGTKYWIKRQMQGTGGFFYLDPDDPSEGGGFYTVAYTTPYLYSITQPSGDVIQINPDTPGSDGFQHFSIQHIAPNHTVTQSIYFTRDPQGRISSVMDPTSGSTGLPVVKYVYDSANNLVQVLKLQDRSSQSYTTNSYFYNNPNFPHYITSMTDSRGVTPLRSLYDSSGKLIGVVDAFGKTNTFTHNVGQNTEIITDRMGNASIYVYDNNGNVVSTTDPLSHTSTETWDAANNLLSQTDPLTNTTYYGYDGSGNRTNVTDALLHVNGFTYDPNTGNLLTHSDPLGDITVNQYDGSGNLMSTTAKDAQGNVVSSSSSTYVNSQLTATYDANGTLTGSFGYDGSGNLTSAQDANGLTRNFGYDANGNQTNTTYTWTNPAGGSPRTVTTSSSYDANGRVTITIDADGNTNSTVYNAIGKVSSTTNKFGLATSYTYNAAGNLIQTVYPDSTVTRTIYDDDGRATYTTDRAAPGSPVPGTITFPRATRTDYDLAGRVTNTVRVANMQIVLGTDASGQPTTILAAAGTVLSTSYTRYLDNGWVQSRTGPDQQTTSYEYYADGQTKAVVDPLSKRTEYQYDPAGRRQLVRDALQHVTQFGYDAVGRQVATIFQDTSFTSNVFNNVGQRTAEIDQGGLSTTFGYSPAGLLTNVTKSSVTNAENNAVVQPQWNYTYDQYGRLFVTQDPKSRVTTNTYDYDGRPITRTLPMGQSETKVYNSLGQLVATTNFSGSVSKYIYDSLGRIQSQEFYASNGQLSNRVCISFDSLGRQQKIVETTGSGLSNSCTTLLASLRGTGRRGLAALFVPMIGLMTFPWKSLRALRAIRGVSAWSRRRRYIAGLRAARGYRPMPKWMRLICAVLIPVLVLTFLNPGPEVLAQAYPCQSPGDLNIRVTTFTYDDDNHVTQICSPEGTINYGYDLVTGRHTSTWTASNNIGYTYDELGRLKTVVVYQRNGVTLTSPEVTTYQYTDVGTRQEVDLPTGAKTTYHYDDLNRLTQLINWSANGQVLSSFNYLLHTTGRRTNVTEVILQADDSSYLTNSIGWSYDGMYRLMQEARTTSGTTTTDSYGYDPVGNRTLKATTINGSPSATTTNVFNANDQLLSETNGAAITTYQYDGNGSLTSQTNITAHTGYAYSYDARNRLSTVSGGSATTSYVYNHAGIRVRSTTGGVTTYSLIDANNPTGYAQVLEEGTTSGTPSMSYVIGDDVIAQATGGGSQYLLYDGHGSTRQLSQPGNTVVQQYNYDAYGQTLGTTYMPATPPATKLLYTGQQFDVNMQQYYLRARYYDPSNGRFDQLDTFSGRNDDPQSLHKYGYNTGDPVNRIDPGGRDGELAELLTSTAVQDILVSVALPVVAQYGAGGALVSLIPASVKNGLTAASAADAVLFGVNGNVNIPVGQYPIGGSFVGGVELLISPHTLGAALYGYLGGGFVFGNNTRSAGAQMTAGLVFNTPSSEKYTRDFLTLTLPYAKLPQPIRNKVDALIINGINAIVATVVDSGSSISAAEIQEAKDLGVNFVGALNKTTCNIFFSPHTGGAFGISFSYNYVSTQDASSNVGASYTWYWQLAPNDDIDVPFR